MPKATRTAVDVLIEQGIIPEAALQVWKTGVPNELFDRTDLDKLREFLVTLGELPTVAEQGPLSFAIKSDAPTFVFI